MIIVSQDKTKMINFDNILCIWIDDNILDKTEPSFTINVETGDFLVDVGNYSTEERAKEVLQQIACRYSSEEMYKRADSKTQEVLTRKYIETKIIPYIFEMPER